MRKTGPSLSSHAPHIHLLTNSLLQGQLALAMLAVFWKGSLILQSQCDDGVRTQTSISSGYTSRGVLADAIGSWETFTKGWLLDLTLYQSGVSSGGMHVRFPPEL